MITADEIMSILRSDFVSFRCSDNVGFKHINHISSSVIGRGFGSRFMESLCKLADDYKFIITANAVPLGGHMDVDQLNRFYHKFGFVNSDATKFFGSVGMFMSNFKVRINK